MKKLLLITYHFPPDAEVGSIRPYQLARHLPEFGFEPWVLTVEPPFAESPDLQYEPEGVPSHRITRTTVDPTLRDRVLGLWRTASREPGETLDDPAERLAPSSPYRATPSGIIPASVRQWALHWLAFPDLRHGWRRPALEAGARLLAGARFEVILSTSPPRVAHMVASELSRRHGVPWVMDLRDPWYPTWTTPHAKTGLLARVHSWLFRRYAAQSALIVTNTEQHRAEVARFLGQGAPRTVCVQNGFDPLLGPPASGRTAAVGFSIGHFGQMSGRRSAVPFLQGLRRWLDQRPSAEGSIRVRFFGSGFAEAQHAAESLRLGVVSFESRVPRGQVPQLMAEEYVLLLLANDQPLQIPGKAYEYLAASRRILAYTERDGATAALLTMAPGCAIAETAQDVAAALDRWWTEYTTDPARHVDREALLSTMTYRRRAEQMATLLGEVRSASAWPSPA